MELARDNLVYIVSVLDFDDQHRLRLTCRAFRQMVEEDAVWGKKNVFYQRGSRQNFFWGDLRNDQLERIVDERWDDMLRIFMKRVPTGGFSAWDLLDHVATVVGWWPGRNVSRLVSGLRGFLDESDAHFSLPGGDWRLIRYGKRFLLSRRILGDDVATQQNLRNFIRLRCQMEPGTIGSEMYREMNGQKFYERCIWNDAIRVLWADPSGYDTFHREMGTWMDDAISNGQLPDDPDDPDASDGEDDDSDYGDVSSKRRRDYEDEGCRKK